jgi:hypothetical protein
MSANEECIEANSCNLPVAVRAQIEGIYTEVCSGFPILCDPRNGPDKRKIVGLPKVIHSRFNDYVAKDHMYLIVDMASGEARVDVISIHAKDKRAAIERMLEEGINSDPLLSAEERSLAA